MKKLLFLFLFLFPFTAHAAYKEVYSPHTGKLDKVGVSTSADVTVVCDVSKVLTSAGAGNWVCADPPGASGGEANTGSNLGSGLENYDSKVGVDLRFNSFNADHFDLASNLISVDSAVRASIDRVVVVSHDAVTVVGENYLSLSGQQITGGTVNDTNMTAEDFGDFTCDSNEDGCTVDADSIALGTDTTGNYAGSGSEGGAATTATALAADPANCASSGLAGGVTAGGVAEACVTPNAGTNIANDLEEEVTEGSLADQTVVTADIKEATILSGDLSFDNVLVDGDIVVYDSTGTNFEGLTCAEITGSADLCDGTDATGAGSGTTEVILPVQSAKITGAFVLDGDATQGAQIDAGNGQWRLLFEADSGVADEAAVWQGVVPENYASVGTLVVDFSMLSGEANEVQFEGAIMCYTPGTDTDNVDTASFSTIAEGSATTVSATAGEVYRQSITLTDDASPGACAAGDDYWIYLSTDADDAVNDDSTGDREVIAVRWNYA